MGNKSNDRSVQGFTQLGLFIVREYNRKTGILAYDPEGLYQDIAQEIKNLCAEEIQAIHDAADKAREELHKEFEILTLKCELAISQAQIRAYDRIFDLSRNFRAVAVIKMDDDDEKRLRKLDADLPKVLEYHNSPKQDAYAAFSCALHDSIQSMHKKNVQTIESFTGWAKGIFKAPDLGQ